MRVPFAAPLGLFVIGLVSCSDDTPAGPGGSNPSSDASATDAKNDDAHVKEGGSPADSGAGSDDPGPAPTQTCQLETDDEGFFTRTTAKGSYYGWVPPTYDPAKPTRLVIGLHGCVADARGWASFAVNPPSTRESQSYIGISLDGATGPDNCWLASVDDAVISTAIADVSSCYWIHRKQIVLSGYSSGGLMTWWLGVNDTSRYAGLLVAQATFATIGDVETNLSKMSWKINMAVRAHTSDEAFLIGDMKTEWATISGAGFPLQSEEVAGDHNPTTEDWEWLISRSETWKAP